VKDKYKMRLLSLSLLVVVFITACGALPSGQPPTATSAIDPNVPTPGPGVLNPDPFATVVPPDGEDTASEDDEDDTPGVSLTLEALGAPVRPSPDPNQTVAPFGGVTVGTDVPPPGVIARRATREPYTGNVIFDRITLIRAGGPTGNERQIEILSDGTVIIDGTPGNNIGPQGLAEVNALMQEIDVFSLTGTFAATVTDPNDYVYVLRVSREGESVAIRADDSLIPDELARVIDRLFFIAEGGPRAPRPRITATPTTAS
jgi:hypothetical protein